MDTLRMMWILDVVFQDKSREEAVRRFKRTAVQQELARQDLNRSVIQSDS